MVEPHPNHVHPSEHVALLEANPDMSAADLRALVEVRLVVRASEQPLEPPGEGAFEALDLSLGLQNSPGTWVGENGLVEPIDDRTVVRL